MSFELTLSALMRGEHPENMEEAFRSILSSEVKPNKIADFLTALHTQGEKVEDLTAAAKIMREKMKRIDAPETAIDVCGTGGDMHATLNISTAVALVVAASGVVVAKHGNRAQSSRSGAADLLEQLGVNLENPEATIKDLGIGFMFAPLHHEAMKYVAPVRQALGFRTIFNLLGPLCNPAGVKRQLVGVFDTKWVEPLARTLGELGSRKVWVVCGKDGMDEITLTTTTTIAELEQGEIKVFELNPEDYGFELVSLDALKGGAPEQNKRAFQALLRGEPSAYRNIVLLNSAAALIVADKVKTMEEGLALARDSLDNRASALLKKWIAYA